MLLPVPQQEKLSRNRKIGRYTMRAVFTVLLGNVEEFARFLIT